MGINETPKGNRMHIGLFGRRNAGKSSLINALTGQEMAIVSHTPGTTTDPVSKAMELHPIGPVVFTDTAGFDDEGELGRQRRDRSRKTIGSTDIAIVVIDGAELADGGSPELEKEWLRRFEDVDCPVIVAINKCDVMDEHRRELARLAVEEAVASYGAEVVFVSAISGEGIDGLRGVITEAAGRLAGEEESLAAGIEEGSLVLLVMPQDIQAPKGRLILPQVQTIRAMLDRKCTVISTTSDGFSRSLRELARDPDLIVTDSQCFGQVADGKPENTPLTSFSILMAKAKGDIDVFMAGAKAIDDLVKKAGRSESDPENHRIRILIAEACTHVPQGEDIGTIKIPRMLNDLFGEAVEITNVRGNDFPEIDALKSHDLIIHCGACMFNRRHVLSRIAAAREACVPITNYGVFLAKMAGILEQVEVR